MKTHKDLDAWKYAMELVKEIYMHSATFPKEEIYGLTSQLRRSAISVPSNTAEGAARNSEREFLQFCYIALGSLAELETQWIIALDLNFSSEKILLERIEKVRKILLGLLKHLKK